jgi:transposase
MGNNGRVGYPSVVSDEEWAFVAPYLALCKEDSEQRDYPLRAVFNDLRYIVRTGSQQRYIPNDLPPWPVVYQQTQRWIRARCFETMVEDLRILWREFSGRKAQPTAMILDSRTPQSTPESGARAGCDGAGPSGARDRRCVRQWTRWGICRSCMLLQPMSRIAHKSANWHSKCSKSRKRMSIWPMWIRDTRERRLKKRPPSMESNCESSSTPEPRGFVLLRRRWVVERSFAWAARFRRLARDYERLATTLRVFHFLAFAWLMITSLFRLFA